MSLTIRRLMLAALGMIAGLTAWPVMEALVYTQARFPSVLSYTAASGAIFGLIYGAIFGSAEGIISTVTRKIIVASALGAGIGAIGGAVGMMAAQGAMYLVGEAMMSTGRNVSDIGIPLARALGWAVLGLFVGAVEGLRSRSGLKIRVGVTGGFLGAFLGGLAIEYARVLIASTSVARLVGLIVFGLSLAGAYAFVERRLSHGLLRVLNGKLKGREFILNQKRLLIGSGRSCDVVLTGYRRVDSAHARISAEKGELYISPLDSQMAIKLNDKEAQKTALKHEDVIQLGTAKLLYLPE